MGRAARFPSSPRDLHLGNAGTALRPLTAVLALAGGHYELSGVARMHERPIGDLVDALRALGADIRYLGNPGFPPLAIEPGSAHAAGAPRSRDACAATCRASSPRRCSWRCRSSLTHGGRRVARRHRRRADLEAVRRDHDASHGALRRRRRAGRVAIVSHPGRRPLFEPGRAARRGRRVVGFVLPGGRRDRRRSRSRHRRGPPFDPGRRRVRRCARPHGRA